MPSRFTSNGSHRLTYSTEHDSERPEVVERIKNSRGEGFSLEIAGSLNAEGIPARCNGKRRGNRAKEGGIWYPSTVRALILSAQEFAEEHGSQPETL